VLVVVHMIVGSSSIHVPIQSVPIITKVMSCGEV